MASLHSSRRLSGGAIAGALVFPVVLGMTTHSGIAVLLGFGTVLGAGLFAGPTAWPELDRIESVAVCTAAALTLVGGGAFATFTILFSLCGSDATRDYVSRAGATVEVAGFAIPYLLGTAWAFRDGRRARWAWPLVILSSLVIGLAVLALVEGGPHHCARREAMHGAGHGPGGI